MIAARSLFFVTLICSFATASLSAQSPFNITLNSGPTLSGNPAAEAAFLRAASQWEAFIDDPISVNIDSEFTPLGPSTLATTAPVILGQAYDTVAQAIFLDAQNEADDVITDFLPNSTQASFNLPDGFTFSGNINATKANLKAIGFGTLDTTFGASDGTIFFGSDIPYDFDNSDGVDPGSLDFETVAAHEIGHILGFTSAVDQVDGLLNAGLTTGAISPTPFDLYRFEDGSVNDPSNEADFNTATRSLVPGSNDIFDQVLPGPGLTELQLSTGGFGGDGEQASHFQDGLNLGVSDPSFEFGQTVLVGTNDVRVLDLIGYEVTAVPEPSSASLITLLVGAAMLRRRRI